MGKIKNLYKEQWNDVKTSYWKLFLFFVILFIAISYICYFSFVHVGKTNPDMLEKPMQLLMSKLGANELEKASDYKIFQTIFINNIRSAFVILLVGFLPLVIVPFLLFSVNAAAMGIVMAFVTLGKGSAFSMLIFGILPHGITEISALILMVTVSTLLSFNVVKKIFSSKRNEITLKKLIKKAFILFFTIIVPILLLSAVIESWVTPIFISHFL